MKEVREEGPPTAKGGPTKEGQGGGSETEPGRRVHQQPEEGPPKKAKEKGPKQGQGGGCTKEPGRRVH